MRWAARAATRATSPVRARSPGWPRPTERRPGEVAGKTLDGDQVSLADLPARSVVVNVWGSWCPPCRAEAPTSPRPRDARGRGRGLPRHRRARPEPRPRPGRSYARFDVPYPSIYDPDGKALLAFRGTLPPNAIPSTVIIDEQGRIAARVLGAVTARAR